MNIKDYEYVVEIAQQGSISKAAARLCITQGALTKYLQRLESQLDLQLFYRIGNQFLLTQVGKAYVAKGKEIVAIDKSLQDEMEIIAASGGTSIRFGCPMGMTPFAMECLFPAFYQKNQTGCISFRENSSNILIQEVSDGKLDICLAYVEEKDTGLEYISLGDNPFVLAVPNDSALLKQAIRMEGYEYPVLQRDDWLLEPYINIATLTRSGESAQEYFQKIGRKPPVCMYVEDTRSALNAVENGIGNSLLAAIPHTDKLVHFLSIPELSKMRRNVCLVVRKNDYVSEQMNRLIQLAQNLYHLF